MKIGEPEADAQLFYEMRDDRAEEVSECEHCKEWVDADEIDVRTNYLCNDCKELDFCICGEVVDKCLYCKPSEIGLLEKIRGFWIGLMQDFI